MKRFILSASVVLLGITAFTPIASAKQASTSGQLSEGATIHNLVQYNRSERDKK
ncbi:MAG: hypothetical protein WA885_02560 [Phormidesmis sp.]